MAFGRLHLLCHTILVWEKQGRQQKPTDGLCIVKKAGIACLIDPRSTRISSLLASEHTVHIVLPPVLILCRRENHVQPHMKGASACSCEPVEALRCHVKR